MTAQALKNYKGCVANECFTCVNTKLRGAMVLANSKGFHNVVLFEWAGFNMLNPLQNT
jgi:hypothetical protein